MPPPYPHGRKHEWDVFVCFSEKDDLPAMYPIMHDKEGNIEVGWVEYFQHYLKKHISANLSNSPDTPKVFFYPERNKFLDNWELTVNSALDSTAIFIVIANENSKKSVECKREIQYFFDALKREIGPMDTGAIMERFGIIRKFINKSLSYSTENWEVLNIYPQISEKRIYESFFVEDKGKKDFGTEAIVPSNETEKPFINKIISIAEAITNKLLEINPHQQGNTTSINPPPVEKSKTILVPGVTGNLAGVRNEIVSTLKRQDYSVLESLSSKSGLIFPDVTIIIFEASSNGISDFSYLSTELILLGEASKKVSQPIRAVLWAIPNKTQQESHASTKVPKLVLPEVLQKIPKSDVLRISESRIGEVLDHIKQKLAYPKNEDAPSSENKAKSNRTTSQEAKEEEIDTPFPGLREFILKDAPVFCGRESQILDLKRLLRKRELLFVLGESGSGKSSLVKAGLVSDLLQSGNEKWLVATLTPGNDPLGSLAQALCKQEIIGPRLLSAYLSLKDSKGGEAAVKSTLGYTTQGLVELLSHPGRIQKDEKLLLIIDQFEEVFRYVESAESSYPEEFLKNANRFVDILIAVKERKLKNVRIVMTMRSDYLRACRRFPCLPDAINEGHYYLPHMTRSQLEAAIKTPVRKAKGEIKGQFVSLLIDKISKEEDQLPLFQHTLARMWVAAKEKAKGSEPITLTDEIYIQLGSPENGLNNHLDKVYKDLDDRQKGIATWLFKLITKEGFGNKPERKPRRSEDVLKIINGLDITGEPVTRKEFDIVVDTFREGENQFLAPKIGDNPLDVIHESVTRCWIDLGKWIVEEQEVKANFSRFIDRAAFWEKKNNEDRHLIPADAFSAYVEQYEEFGNKDVWGLRFGKQPGECKSVEDYWAACKSYFEAVQKRKKIWVAIKVGMPVLLAVIFGYFSIVLNKKNNDLLASNFKEAQSRITISNQRDSLEDQNKSMKLLSAKDKEQILQMQSDSVQIALLNAERDNLSKQQIEDLQYRQRLLGDRLKLATDLSVSLEENARKEKENARKDAELMDAKFTHIQDSVKAQIEQNKKNLSTALLLARASKDDKLSNPELRKPLALTALEMHSDAKGKPNQYEIYEALAAANGNAPISGAVAPEKLPNEVIAMRCDPSGQNLALACGDYTVFYQSGGSRTRLFRAQASVKSLAFSPAGNRLACGDNSGNLWVCNLPASGTAPVSIPTGFIKISHVAFLGSEDEVVVAGGAGQLALVKGNVPTVIPVPQNGTIVGMESIPGGVLVATASGAIYEIRNGTTSLDFKTNAGIGVTCMTYNATQKLYALGFSSGVVQWYSLGHKSAGKVAYQSGNVTKLAFSTDGNYLLAVRTGEGRLIQLDQPTETAPRIISPAGLWTSVSFCRNVFVAGEKTGTVYHWAARMEDYQKGLCERATIKALAQPQMKQYGGGRTDLPTSLCK